jgi:hypothetical protein
MGSQRSDPDSRSDPGARALQLAARSRTLRKRLDVEAPDRARRWRKTEDATSKKPASHASRRLHVSDATVAIRKLTARL